MLKVTMEQFMLRYWWVLLLLALWTLLWKGIALWKAAQNDHRWWFVAMLLVNDLGLLEMLYIFHFGKSGREMNA